MNPLLAIRARSGAALAVVLAGATGAAALAWPAFVAAGVLALGYYSYSFATIHLFREAALGLSPTGDLVGGTHGALYGVTEEGGAFGKGTVYELVPPARHDGVWTQTVLYDFGRVGDDGQMPVGGLVRDHEGNLYGVTLAGGASALCKDGCGTVFRLAPPAAEGGVWTETQLHSFAGGTDGARPYAKPLLGRGGVIYGTASSGGDATLGTVYALVPKSGTYDYNTVYSFLGPDGAVPLAPLMQSHAGELFGTASQGGPVDLGYIGGGVAFRLTPPRHGTRWALSDLVSFGEYKSGSPRTGYPAAGLTVFYDQSGQLYAYTTTRFGGYAGRGSVSVVAFYMYSNGYYSENGADTYPIYSFGAAGDGANPVSGLLKVGTTNVLYGTTAGSAANLGTIFKLTNDPYYGTWHEQVLVAFPRTSRHGASPSGGLTPGPFGLLYGVTFRTASAGAGGVAYGVIH